MNVVLNLLWEAQKKNGNTVQRNFIDQSKLGQWEIFVREVLAEISSSGAYLPGQPFTQKYSTLFPSTITVENEEENDTYYVIDPPVNGVSIACDKYFAELTRTAMICSEYTRSDAGCPLLNYINVTNGGMTTRLLTYLTYDYKKSTDLAGAQNWAKYVMPPSDYNKLTNTFFFAGLPKSPGYVTIQDRISIGKYYLNKYYLLQQQLSIAELNAFYLNIHWYEPCYLRGWDDSKDGLPTNYPTYYPGPDYISQNGLTDVLNFLNNPAYQINGGNMFFIETTETGQCTVSGALTTSTLTNMFNLSSTTPGNFGLIVWYDGDGDFLVNNQNELIYNPGTLSTQGYKAKALHTINSTGTTAINTPQNGSAFQAKILSQFNSFFFP